MKSPFTVVSASALALAVAASAVDARNDDMMKWTTAEVVHYDVVAEYAGVTVVLVNTAGQTNPYRATVSDRYEVGFDWNPAEMSVVGKPEIRNFPSALPKGTPGGSSLGQPCPEPKLEGVYDHVEVVSVKGGLPGSNSAEVTFKRMYPAGKVAYAGENRCDNWHDMPAKTETLTSGFVVPPGLYFAMPQAAGSNLTVGKDGKTMTHVDGATGWKYTYTLRIVK